MNHSQTKALYLQGKSISEIAQMLGISRATVYNHKSKDLAQGMDWEELRFLKATDSREAQQREESFVALLIHRFEATLEQMDSLSPEQQLKELTQVANVYYKLKMQRENPKVNKADLAKQTLHQLSQLALAQEAQPVLTFLADNADAIVAAVME